MNAGKSTALLTVNHNYHERGMHTLLLTCGFDTRYGCGQITSRIGISAPANIFNSDTDLVKFIDNQLRVRPIDCILVDEAQFLTRKQVEELAFIVDSRKIPVMCYGLKVDFKQSLFEGSAALFALADKIEEMKTICHCGRKATQIAKVNDNGDMVDLDSPQVEIGGNDRYISMCRKHYNELKNKSKN